LGANYFSKNDLKSGYHQVLIEKIDCWQQAEVERRKDEVERRTIMGKESVQKLK